MKPKILISTSSFGQTDVRPVEMLNSSGVEYVMNPYGRKLKREETVSLLRDMDGLIAGTEMLDKEILKQFPKLGVISRCGTGTDNIDMNAADEFGIRIFNTPDAHVNAVAELTLAGILDLLRSVSYADRIIRQKGWEKPMGKLLREKTVGIIGMGRVGKALAILLQPFKNTIFTYDVYEDKKFAEQYGICYSTLNDLLMKSDIVTLHMPYHDSFYHFLDRSRLASVKKGAFVVNCGRGGLIDEQALYEFLKEHRIGGAYIDTFEKEPYQGPLIELPNVILTPHIGSYAAECRTAMEIQAVENLLQFFQRKEK